ncbi:MAG: hypothetical protein HY821_05845 [Acidobacteria bacterium]|nr:hypothetical protein [Acidobacteriota bacterium]
MLRTAALFLSALPLFAADLPVGARLPNLQGDFLTGRPAVLPQAASGRVALLALGFTYDSRHAVEAWVKRFRTQFGQNPQAAFFQIPMLGGAARMGRWFIENGMRRGTPKDDQDRVITVYGGSDPWKQRLAFKDPNAAYLILIDQQGVVRWLHSGPFDERAYQRLSAETDRLLAARN